MRRLRARSMVLIAGTLILSACHDSNPPVEPSMLPQGSRHPGRVFLDIPEVAVELPRQPRPWDLDDQALVDAVAGGDGVATVSFKEPGSARVKDTGIRAAVTGRTVEEGVRMLEALGVEVRAHLRNMGAVIVRITPSLAPTLSSHPLVDYVEPRQMRHLDGVPMRSTDNRALLAQTTPWGVTMIGAPSAWQTTRGSGAKILVMDTPYFRDHEDLPHIPDANCGNGGCTPGQQSHGTFVLGEITARDNSVGIVGVANGVVDGRVFFWAACSGEDGRCFTDLVVQGIDWGITQGVQVINMSFGGPVETLDEGEAVNRAWNANIVLVAAAGNCRDNDPAECEQFHWPAAYNSVLAVSGVRDNGLFANTSPCVDAFERTATSKYGVWVDLAGPFWSRSTVNNGGYQDEQFSDPLGANPWCGTSMAAPFVTGTVALMRSKNPDVPNFDIVRILFSTAEDRGSEGWDIFYGDGIVRADGAVAAVPFPPPPCSVTISGPGTAPAHTSVEVTANPSNCTSPITYAWTVNGSPACGNQNTCSAQLGASGTFITFAVSITDADGDPASDDHSVMAEWPECPECAGPQRRQIRPAGR